MEPAKRAFISRRFHSKFSEFSVHFFQGGLKSAWGHLTAKHVPLSRASMRVWYEKRGFFGGNKFVSAYVERDKKNLKKWIFVRKYLRELFEVKDSQF